MKTKLKKTSTVSHSTFYFKDQFGHFFAHFLTKHKKELKDTFQNSSKELLIATTFYIDENF